MIAAGLAFGIDANDLAATFDADFLRGGDAGVAASHGDGLQQIDPFRAAIGHFVAARSIHLAQHGKATFGVTDQHHVYLRIDQIVATVKIGELRCRLAERETGKMN